MENKVNGNLPEELLHEILCKLPVKDLLRCKCICKEWHAIIESPSFVDHHFGHESNQEILLLQEDSYTGVIGKPNPFSLYQDEEMPSRVEESKFLAQIPNGHRLEVLLGPSNGVFCAVSDLISLIVLFNPATRELKELPPILYDGHPCRLMFGFGFDPSTRDYKVVAFERHGSPPHSMFVYNLSSNSWKRIEVGDSFKQLKLQYESCYYPFLNGVYHWLVEMVDDQHLGILALDMRSEKFHVIQAPYCLRNRKGLTVAAYGDSLAVISYKEGENIDLWAMGRDGIWTKSLTVGPFQGPLWPICVWKNALIFEIETTGLIRCDVSTKSTREIIPFLELGFVRGLFFYKESIISIKGVRDGTDCVQDIFDHLPEPEYQFH